MSEYSGLEKFIAEKLLGLPRLKRFVKRPYQLICSYIFRKSYKFRSSVSIDVVDDIGRESFFGYYDKSPENDIGSHVIFYRPNLETTHLPSSSKKLDIISKNLTTGEMSLVGKTRAYNWQQGARLFWLDSANIIYNDYIQEKYCACLMNLSDGSVKTLPIPVYDGYEKEYFLSCNFDKLHDLRPDYGYRNRDVVINYNDVDVDGVFRYDFNSNESRLIISYRSLLELNHLDTMHNAKHKVNHIMISPKGTYFMFMHRWHRSNGVKYDRLLLSDSEGKNIQILVDEGGVSHCCWKSDTEIIGYFKHNGLFGWYEIDVLTGQTKLISDKLNSLGDGHPSFKNGKLLIDSYPNRSRMKNMYLYDYHRDSTVLIGEFYESLNYYGQTRCDLHPRFNFSGDKIYIDSVHTGKRKLYCLDNTGN